MNHLSDLAANPLTWGGYIIRPTDPKFTDIRQAPNVPGIYAMYTKDGDLMYVGRSVAISDRLWQHKRRSHFVDARPVFYSWREVPEFAIAGVEVAHIKALTPIENRFMEAGVHAIHDQMMEAISATWADCLPEMKRRIDENLTRDLEQIASRL